MAFVVGLFTLLPSDLTSVGCPLIANEVTQSHSGFVLLTRSVSGKIGLHSHLFIDRNFLARCSVAQPSITNESALSDSDAKPNRISLPHIEDVCYSVLTTKRISQLLLESAGLNDVPHCVLRSPLKTINVKSSRF